MSCVNDKCFLVVCTTGSIVVLWMTYLAKHFSENLCGVSEMGISLWYFFVLFAFGLDGEDARNSRIISASFEKRKSAVINCSDRLDTEIEFHWMPGTGTYCRHYKRNERWHALFPICNVCLGAMTWLLNPIGLRLDMLGRMWTKYSVKCSAFDSADPLESTDPPELTFGAIVRVGGVPGFSAGPRAGRLVARFFFFFFIFYIISAMSSLAARNRATLPGRWP